MYVARDGGRRSSLDRSRDGARRSLVPTSSCIRTREAHPGRSAAVAVPGPTRAAGRLGRTGTRTGTGTGRPRHRAETGRDARTGANRGPGARIPDSLRAIGPPDGRVPDAPPLDPPAPPPRGRRGSLPSLHTVS